MDVSVVDDDHEVDKIAENASVHEKHGMVMAHRFIDTEIEQPVVQTTVVDSISHQDVKVV